MSKFTQIKPAEITDNTFKLIGSDWMLVTSANDCEELEGGVNYNTMTASWGGVGILWNKPVAFVFIRPQRHTFGFTEKNDRMTLSFFGEEYREALKFCGRESGRDYDKAKECALTPMSDRSDSGRAVWFDEARLVLKVKKLYSDVLKKDCFKSESALNNYPTNDFHTVYVCEIEEAIIKD